MASSEVSVKGSRGRGEGLSSGCSEPHEGAPMRDDDEERSLGLSGGAAVRKGFDFSVVSLADSEDALYTELWHACAGPLVTIPRMGERVFYFPQGHMEQVRRGSLGKAHVCPNST
ncbi:hypothetical protein BHE74_00032531 [Ensete ventricosum]|nr:hypothetical protein GW17_00027330 [Ensete ventricosum]RWW60476.1 hypothetical protein BHE74_00032531 [Ensete ventricosum]RZS07539.1 hypothetical protein BHM03_00038395 [Ensete ventricosum]